MSTTENLKLTHAKLVFHRDAVFLKVYPNEGARMYAFYVLVVCKHLDRQVASAARILGVLRPILSAVVHLVLLHRKHTFSSVWHDEVDRRLWCQLLSPFNNVKTIRVPNGLARDLSRFLDGEPPSYGAITQADGS